MVRHATRVQRRFRIWIVDVRMRHLAEQRRKRLMEESLNMSESLDLNKMKAHGAAMLTGPIRAMGRMATAVKATLFQDPVRTYMKLNALHNYCAFLVMSFYAFLSCIISPCYVCCF